MEHLKSLDAILAIEENSQPKNSSEKKIKFKAMLAIGIMIGASAGLYIYNHSTSPGPMVQDSNEVKQVDTSSITKEIKENTVSKIEKIISPVYDSKLITESNRAKIEQAGQFNLPEGLADNQVARKVAQTKFNEGNYYLSIVSEAEGFRSRLYNDVGGYAGGNGWNLTMQSKTNNENIAKAISKDSNFIQKVTALSGKYFTAPATGYVINFTPQRSMQASELLGEQFEQGVINVLSKKLSKNKIGMQIHSKTGQDYRVIATDMLNKLEKNEKSAIIYHTYKVGEGGFSKYNNLIDNLINYAFSQDKSIEAKKKVAEGITYQYKMNGEVKKDIRAEVFVQSMFMDKEAFGFLIGKNVAPQHMKTSIPSINKNNINVSVPSEKVVIPDPVGDRLNEIEKAGGNIDIAVDYTNVEKLQNKTTDQNIQKRSHRFM